MSELEIHAVPKNLYYHEVAYVRGLKARAEKAERERDEVITAANARIAELEKDAARWRALVTTFGPEMDVSTPHRPHTMLIAIDTEGCEVREDGNLDFKETLERALDDEIKRQSAAAAAAAASAADLRKAGDGI